jgi:hypothetical protein
MELPDQDSFVPTFPIRMIVVGDKFDPRIGQLQGSCLEATEVNGMTCLPLFTDEDLASRYCELYRIPKQYAFVVDMPDLIRNLVNAKENDFKGVVFDAGSTNRLSAWMPIDAAISHFRRML